MFKFITVVFAVVASVSAKPGVLAPLGYSAPLAAFSAPFAYNGSPYANIGGSSQVDIRQNYNAFPAPYYAASAAYVSPAAVATPFAAKYAASAPFAVSPYAASPYAVSPYVASPYAAPFAVAPYSTPLTTGITSFAGAPFATQAKYASTVPFAAAPLKYTAGTVVL